MANDVETDIELLRAVARRSDRGAFRELFDRHVKGAMSLSRRITLDPESAEDAVQEAMLRVWRHADSFFSSRPDGNVRSWLLRIVAHESARLVRKRKGRSAMVQGESGSRIATTERSPSEDAERGERLSAVGDCIEQLPDKSRRLVALHFGAGLTHEEIGQVLSMPRSTVSHGIRDALRRLKGSLARAGVAAIALPTETEVLGEAICSGYPVPAGLCQRVMARMDALGAAAESARQSARRALGMRVPLVVGIVLVAAIAGGAGWWAVRGSPATSREAHREQKPFRVSFTFENGIPESFEVIESRWAGWRPRKGERPAALMSPPGVENDAQCVLPVEVPPRPLLATARFFCPSEYAKMGRTRNGFSLYYVRKGESKTRFFSRWNRILNRPNRPMSVRTYEEPYRVRIYFIDEYVLEFYESRRFVRERDYIRLRSENLILGEVFRYRASYPSNRLIMGMHGLGLEELEIRELTEDEIPPMLRDPEKIVERLGRTPKVWRTK